MRSVRSANTKLEVRVRKALFKRGFRYRKNVKKLSGSPDIVLTKFKTVIFINGCFWHGHENCTKSILPKSNLLFWSTKIEKNKIRDILNIHDLERTGWTVITIWECEMDTTAKFEKVIDLLVSKLSARI